MRISGRATKSEKEALRKRGKSAVVRRETLKKIVSEYEFSKEQLSGADALAKATGLEEATARILYARGVDNEEKVNRFMHPGKENFLSPFLMRGMRELQSAFARLKERGGTAAVFCDYDADGICSAAIFYHALKKYGVRARIYVPERTDGYGLNREGIDKIFAEGTPDLFVTADCGVSCKDEVAYIKSSGVEVIVTDHHELPRELPDCVIINPKLADDYPYDNLCGAGVAFKVACALLGEEAYELLDFAALATVADSVPLLGENRDIVTEGLKLFNASRRLCFTCLLGRTAEKAEEEITAQTLAYSVAPRVNAAGRMGDSFAAYRLFIAEDDEEIRALAAKLCAYNCERQKKCDELYLTAKRTLLKEGAYSHVIILTGEDWNAGFVGIVAARIAEEYNRPTLIFVRRGDMFRGSARSVENVNIFNALCACSQYIEEFGGHAQAAGVNVKAEDFEAFKSALDREIASRYSREDFILKIPVAQEMTCGFSAKFIRELTALEPYGVGHRKPLFSLTARACVAKEMKPASPHVTVKNEYLDLVYFSGAKHLPIIRSDVEKTFVFEINVSRFKGREYVKGLIRDFTYDGRTGTAPEFSAFSSAIDRFFADKTERTAEEQDGFTSPVALSAFETRELIEKKAKEGDWGLCLVASDAGVLSSYPYLKNAPCDLFYPSSKNLGNVLLVAPFADADLSGYDTVIYLDAPLSFRMRLPAGKTAYYNREVDGKISFETLDTKRETLAGVFTALKNNAAYLQGDCAAALVERCGAFGFDKKEFLFALRVFEELKILDFSFGAPTLYRGVKTDLSRSSLYETVRLMRPFVKADGAEEKSDGKEESYGAKPCGEQNESGKIKTVRV